MMQIGGNWQYGPPLCLTLVIHSRKGQLPETPGDQMCLAEHQRQDGSARLLSEHLLSRLIDLDQLRVRDASLADLQFITEVMKR
eukprot:5053622-Prymnesium_polylepis.1